ncbi:MAG: Asp-tRNA(Asn)/Glu-tRNA(Gln) amidotransferase subunit GatA [Candidatus Yonathbacteria bacterium]|nr:Asp-tRNA(Asn)/Glu-tRNA(Gln) amidotransferase subunit GatA [Candidatus Yonathbacteria bacterium]NTW47449.1 Asp-tRNA(Asn)/Glu-tRNA(Gln) amidotransferase subunit GatA [Candidatus Yonathbacteria bacterium]
MDILHASIKELRTALDARDITAVMIAEAFLSRIKEVDTDIHAFLELYDDVLEQARHADTLIAAGNIHPLTGIPVALKDNLLIVGKHASSASKILEGYVAPYDAHVITRLKDEGAVFLGRTNMDEFAMGGSTENSAYGPTKNPHDMSRVPGGSSGGSAAAVAARMAPLALGSDTGGSIRQPASFCGIVGLKPTYGAVSRRGVMAMGSSLDQIGPFGRTVADTKALFACINGYDAEDSTSVSEETRRMMCGDVRTTGAMRIGVPESFVYGEGVDEDVKENFRATLRTLETAGHSIVPIELPTFPYALAVYYIIMPAEVSTNLARFDGVRYGLYVSGNDLLEDYMKTRGTGFGKEVRRRIMLGTYVLSAGYYDAYYNKANEVREALRAELVQAFSEVNVIATPTSPTPAFRIGEKASDPLQMYLADIFTVPVNIAGVPAISVPSGTVMRDGQALPLGMQFIAPHFAEETLFSIASEVERLA